MSHNWQLVLPSSARPHFPCFPRALCSRSASFVFQPVDAYIFSSLSPSKQLSFNMLWTNAIVQQVLWACFVLFIQMALTPGGRRRKWLVGWSDKNTSEYLFRPVGIWLSHSLFCLADSRGPSVRSNYIGVGSTQHVISTANQRAVSSVRFHHRGRSVRRIHISSLSARWAASLSIQSKNFLCANRTTR